MAAATPFVMSFFPSERAKAAGAPVEVDIGKLEPGQKIDVEWRGKVVWIINRTPPMLDSLPKLDPRARGPEFRTPRSSPATARTSIARSRTTCWSWSASARTSAARRRTGPEVAPADLGPDWLGGFFCPCHQSKFDLAGRVYSGVPAPTNLPVPPHKYVTDTRIIIGDDGKSA